MVENHLYFNKGTTAQVGTMGVLPEVRGTEAPQSIWGALPRSQSSGELNCAVQLTGTVVKALGRLFSCKQIRPPLPPPPPSTRAVQRRAVFIMVLSLRTAQFYFDNKNIEI